MMDYFPSPEVELDDSARELMESINRWVRAECVDCTAQFTNEGEAFEHGRILADHTVLHAYSTRTVN